MDINHPLQTYKVLTKENKLLRESINLGLRPYFGWGRVNFFLVPGTALCFGFSTRIQGWFFYFSLVLVRVPLGKSLWYPPLGEISRRQEIILRTCTSSGSLWGWTCKQLGKVLWPLPCTINASLVSQLRKPEARGVEVWPKVTLAARHFPWVTNHGNYCDAF